MKYFIVFLVLIGSSGLITQIFADGDHAEFLIDGYIITTNSNKVSDISLDWDSEVLPEGTVTFSEPYTGLLEIQIPKNMPRTMNLNYETSLFLNVDNAVDGQHVFESENTLYDDRITETESKCFYILSMNLENVEYFEIVTGSVAAGRWEPVAIENEECNYVYNESYSQNRSVFPRHGFHAWNIPPLKQFNSGVPIDEIQCRESLTLVTKNNGFPACVKEQTLLKLVERGLIITSKAERDLMLEAGYKLYSGVGWVKNARENTITLEPPSEYLNSCPPWKFYNETEKTCNVILPCPDNMFFSDVSQECEFSRTPPPEPEPERTSDAEMQLYYARKSLQNAYQNHLNLGPYYMKDVVVGFGTYDDALVVDISSKYTDSDSFQIVKKEIQHIVGNDISVDYVVYDESIERHIATVIPYLWNKILHQKNIDFTPKDQTYWNNADGFLEHDKVCSPLVFSNGTDFFISSTFDLEPFEITGTYIDKTQPNNCHKIWKTDVLMIEPDRVTALWLENEN